VQHADVIVCDEQDQVMFLPNPCTFSINEVVIAVSTNDVIRQVRVSYPVLCVRCVCVCVCVCAMCAV
jgi:hypothetical protein